MRASELIEKLKNGSFDNSIVSLYEGKDKTERRDRILSVATEFLSFYGDLDVVIFSSPGRTEISGNHTDHNNGLVLASAVDIDIVAIAAKTNDKTVRIKSIGYREETIDISSPSPEKVRKASSEAIIAGIADYFRKQGFIADGFTAYTVSEVATGSGLSSSAAFEMLCAKIFSYFYNDNNISPIELAKAGKYSENLFFGKPCGLMDQAVCSVGGCVFIDFKNNSEPTVEKLDFDIKSKGYSLCIINTGGSHSDLTEDYASVTSEMRSVSLLMGKPNLRCCEEADFLHRIPYIRTLVGDRACMRAMHYFAENRRVDAQKEAIKKGDFDRFFELVTESGNSSFKYLQNAYTVKNVKEQGIPLALAISERHSRACRLHGGGFAGTIQAYVKNDVLDSFVGEIEAIFGNGSCKVLNLRKHGTVIIKENEILD